MCLLSTIYIFGVRKGDLYSDFLFSAFVFETKFNMKRLIGLKPREGQTEERLYIQAVPDSVVKEVSVEVQF